MSYKQERRNGKWVTIDTRTGQEVGMFRGSQRDLLDDTLTNLRLLGSDLKNSISDFNNDYLPQVTYSDTAVDKNGYPITRAAAGEARASGTRDARLRSILQTAPQTPTVQSRLKNLGVDSSTKETKKRSSTEEGADERYTVSGVTYDRDSGQAVNPKTNQIAKDGYSIDPQTGERYDYGTSSGGTDTRTGTKFDNFQAQQQDLMDRRAGLQTEFSPEGVSSRNVDPRTAELIRGIPRDPFSSTSLPYTDFSEDGPQFDLGIDPSKMLSRMEGIDFSEDAKDFTDFSKGLSLKDAYAEDYVSPVNFSAPKYQGDPMLNPDIDSATAMQMKNRDAGLMYASGQFFAEGEGGQPVLVNRQLAKDVRSGKEGAQAQLDAYLAGGGMRPRGSEENPGFGVIEDISLDKMFEMSQTTPEQIADSGYSAEDMESFGVPKASAKGMGQGDYVQYYNEGDFDEDISDGTLIDGGITPFTQKLLR